MLEMLIKVMVGKGVGVHDEMEGGYKSWSKDAKHRREAKAYNIFRDVWSDRNGPLPWRLTKEEIKLLDKRCKRTVWPHYMDRVYYDKCSFWLKPGRMWKTRRKVRYVCLFLYDNQPKSYSIISGNDLALLATDAATGLVTCAAHCNQFICVGTTSA